MDLNVKLKTVKLQEDKQEKNLDVLRFGNDFLGTTPKAQFIKEIIGKMDFIKFELYPAEDNVKKMRR